MARPAIEAQGLGKSYRRFPSARARAWNLLTLGRLGRGEERRVLAGIELAVERGSALGVVGANGAGKSTLLGLLAGLIAPTAGRYRIDGRRASLIELGAGFHLDFTGRENIRYDGVLRGLSRRELALSEERIAAFAELGDALDEPVRTYSQGMGLRLAFAIALAAEPDVLLVDEVFAVGDLRFQRKCVDRLTAWRARGGTLVFCSHSLYDVRQLCDEALWLDRGRARAQGDAIAVTGAYAAACEPGTPGAPGRPGPPGSPGSPGPDSNGPRFTRVAVTDPAGADLGGRPVRTGDRVEVALAWRNPGPEPVHVAVAFERPDRTILAAAGTQFGGDPVPGVDGRAVLELPDLGFLSGSFSVRAVLFDQNGVHRHDERLWEARLEVRATTREVGLVRLPHRWRLGAEGVAA